MQHLEVSGAVQPLKLSLGVKWLIKNVFEIQSDPKLCNDKNTKYLATIQIHTTKNLFIIKHNVDVWREKKEGGEWGNSTLANIGYFFFKLDRYAPARRSSQF